MAIEAVLWDLDGTLISTKRLYIEAYIRALTPYAKRAITEEDVRTYRVLSELRFLRAMAPDDYDACVADFRRHYAELHETHFGGVYDGVTEVLDELRQRGLKLGIVTGKSRSSWEVTSAVAQLGAFDVTVMDEDVAEPKPDPEGLRLALQELRIDAADALFVGDSVSDIQAARAAGIVPVAALWSKDEQQHAGFLRRLGEQPVQVALQPADLLLLIQKGIG